LAPAAFTPRLFQFVAHVCGQAIQPQRFDMLLYIFPHASYNKAYFCAFQVHGQNHIDHDNKYNIAYHTQNGAFREVCGGTALGGTDRSNTVVLTYPLYDPSGAGIKVTHLRPLFLPCPSSCSAVRPSPDPAPDGLTDTCALPAV